MFSKNANTVWVAIYSHKHSKDISVYTTDDAAENARIAMAGEFQITEDFPPFTRMSEDADE